MNSLKFHSNISLLMFIPFKFEGFVVHYWIMSIFDKNKQIKDILLNWLSNSFYLTLDVSFSTMKIIKTKFGIRWKMNFLNTIWLFITTRYYYSGIIIIIIIIIIVRQIFYFYLLRDHISITCSLYLFCYSFYLYILVFFEFKKNSY